MGRSISLGNLFDDGWWTEERTCRKCGYTDPDDEAWETEVHTAGFGIAIISVVCPQCNTVHNT